MTMPVLALVGRPNTGKSTLFNTLTGRQTAIVGPEPGVTRDRIIGEADWDGLDFQVIDTGGIDFADNDIQRLVQDQAEVAIDAADVLCLVCDLKAGLSDLEYKIADKLRKSGKPVIVAVNKVDRPGDEPDEFYAFYALGFEHVFGISASHKLGLPEFLDAVTEPMKAIAKDDASDQPISIAVSGRPNVGKSTLCNALIGETRSIVSDIPGTTRDAIRTLVDNEYGRFYILDTAGIRRQSKVTGKIEYVSVLTASRSVKSADVCLLVLDAIDGPTAQDTKIAGIAHNEGIPAIFLFNKWDAVDHGETSQFEMEKKLRSRFPFMSYAPVLFISAKTGLNLPRIWPQLIRSYEAARRRIATSLLNEVVAEAVIQHPTPQKKGRHLKIYYATQVSTCPPTIVFFVNDRKLVHFSYERYLENSLREAFDFDGTPIRIQFKGKAARDEKSSNVTPN